MSADKKTVASSTDSVHAGIPKARPHHALSLSIEPTATFTFADTAELERYMRGEDPDPEREEYGRYGNPTVCELERRVAELELAEAGVAFSSGMAAIATALLSLVKAGDHVVLFRDGYRRTRQLVTSTLARFGVEHSVVASGDLGALSAALRDNTRLVIAESPTNPYLYCVDLQKLSELVKARGRIRTLVDATFATPINCRPLEFGADLVVHSATKYLSGHNDVLGGVVVGPHHLISLLRDARGVLGSVLDPHAAFLIARGIKTLGVRVERQNASSLAVARALEAHPRVERVFYPMLESHPSHAIARTQMRGGGGVVSFIVKGGYAAAARFIDALKIPKIAASLGGVESLIEQPALMSYSELSPEELAKIGIDPALVRMSVGIEDTEDLLQDLAQALST
jgi:cystathionine gamma-synthase